MSTLSRILVEIRPWQIKDSLKGRETGFTQMVNSFLQVKSTQISQKGEKFLSLKVDGSLNSSSTIATFKPTLEQLPCQN